ncbi:MAG: hypothetical protein ABIJ16_11145 [Bacteroidota bacterium]
MKKTIIAVAIVIMIIIGLLVFNATGVIEKTDIYQSLMVLILAGIGMIFGVKRIMTKKGEPVEDEMSKMVLQKASSLSYYISLYFWLVIIYMNDKVELETEQLFGYGIAGMAVIFVISWFYYKFKGVSNG